MLDSAAPEPDHRRTGAAGLLTDAFVAWARGHGCVEAHVDCYAANEDVIDLYDRVRVGAKVIVPQVSTPKESSKLSDSHSNSMTRAQESRNCKPNAKRWCGSSMIWRRCARSRSGLTFFPG